MPPAEDGRGNPLGEAGGTNPLAVDGGGTASTDKGRSCDPFADLKTCYKC